MGDHRLMKALILAIGVVVAGLLPSLSLATAQEPDLLVIDGKTVALETNPLSSLIKSGTIKLPEPDEQWSSNWRGYVAKWELREDRLILKELTVLLLPPGAKPEADAAPTNVLQTVFDGKDEVPANWYTGTLVLPRGDIINYVHMGYGSTYERYTVLRINSGQLVSHEDLSADQFMTLRKQRFAEYQRTPEYAARLKEARSDFSAQEAENFLFEYSVEEYMAVDP